ncbi:FAD-dependent monooxygenase [Legionella waltersii]|uniref:FAD dependent oxidoreductase n=1 Tax=Legionella waltersii TaxID=66969 RepID=A0A0W1A063_9GAMM|nr:FAD-dependent monooxygenase [Legionella waltersii]KTD74748.1 FAD dependent oxidoreductase [Legionella waltersii]SNV00211.1 FAD dependent oxidoreductase [Legionella waltersii]
MAQKNIDVLIIGAGPVGLFCANELTRHGLTCRIIDKKSTLSDKSKALGIHIRTLDVLEDCGLIDEVLKQGHQVDGVVFKSCGKTLVNATLDGIEASRHCIIDLPQNQTEAILYEALLKKGVQVEWDTELTHLNQSPQDITATIKKPNNKIELFSVNWLVACDGAHSTVCHELGAEFKGSPYKNTWWLADLHVDWSVPENRMAIYINKRGPLACFPMGNKRYRLVMTAPDDVQTEPQLLDIDKEFKQRSSDPATLSDPIWLSQFTIHHRQIQQYRYERIFFAGDAAHIHSPMGGQGLNTGMQDAYNLAWKIALVERGKANPSLLDSYHEERYPIGHQVLRKTDVMTKMILLKNPVLVNLRNHFIQLMTSFSKIKRAIMKDIAELTISYAKSPIVNQLGKAKGLKAGKFLPTFELTNANTQEILDSIKITRGISHHLFLFAGTKTNDYSELMTYANALQHKYGNLLQIHLVLNQKQLQHSNNHLTTWVDSHTIQEDFGFKKPSLVLVRPDKYIGILQNPINKKQFEDELYLVPLATKSFQSSAVNLRPDCEIQPDA